MSIFAHTPRAVREAFHRRVPRALQPGGLLILEAYTPGQVGRTTGGPQDESLTMTLAALESELDGLVFELGTETERDVHEGSGHTGLGAVVQVLARQSGDAI